MPEPYEGEENELSSSDEDTDICNKYRIKFTATKKDIKQFLPLFVDQNNLLYTLNLFAFLYDLSDVENSLKDLLLFFQSMNNKYKLKNDNPIIIFGTKKDKKKQPKESVIKDFNSLIESLPNVYHYEIATKPNFDFNKFFSEFACRVLNYQGAVSKSQIEQITEKIEQKQNFSKAPKFEKIRENASPGPAKYLNNIYDTDNIKERIEALTGNKRFNTKLFINKKGPTLHQENAITKKEDPFNRFRNKYEIQQKAKLQKVAEYLMGEKKGYSFGGGGIVAGSGKKLLEERKKKAELRNELYYNAFREPSIFNKPKSKSKTNIRYENNENNEDNKSVNTRESKPVALERYNSLVKENKSKLSKEFENKSKIILEKNKKLTDEERNKMKEKYKDIIFGNNSVILKKTDEKIKEIQQNREKEKSPPIYDVSRSLLDEKKGFSIISRRPPLSKNINDAPYVYIQSDFDKCANNIKVGSISYAKRNNIKPIETENDKKVFDEKKFDKYAENRLNSERYQNTKDFLNERDQKRKMHNILYSELKEQEQLYYKNLKASTSNSDYDNINYNLVESSSPKYSMRGKYDIDENRENRFLLFGNYGKNNLMLEPNKIEPNYDYIKPAIKSFKFSKDERFKVNKTENNLNPGPLSNKAKSRNLSSSKRSANASKSDLTSNMEKGT